MICERPYLESDTVVYVMRVGLRQKCINFATPMIFS